MGKGRLNLRGSNLASTCIGFNIAAGLFIAIRPQSKFFLHALKEPGKELLRKTMPHSEPVFPPKYIEQLSPGVDDGYQTTGPFASFSNFDGLLGLSSTEMLRAGFVDLGREVVLFSKRVVTRDEDTPVDADRLKKYLQEESDRLASIPASKVKTYFHGTTDKARETILTEGFSSRISSAVYFGETEELAMQYGLVKGLTSLEPTKIIKVHIPAQKIMILPDWCFYERHFTFDDGVKEAYYRDLRPGVEEILDPFCRETGIIPILDNGGEDGRDATVRHYAPTDRLTASHGVRLESY